MREKMIRAIRSKGKKKNNVVILINAENSEELKAIKEEFLLSARKAARKWELGFYVAPADEASLETIQHFVDLSGCGMGAGIKERKSLLDATEDYLIGKLKYRTITAQEIAAIPQILAIKTLVREMRKCQGLPKRKKSIKFWI